MSLAMLVAGLVIGGWFSTEESPDVTPAKRTGQICVAHLPEEAREADAETGNQRGYTTYEFWVRIDEGEWVRAPGDRSVWIRPVSLAQRHLLELREGERRIESFWFTFEQRGGADLCSSYKPFYQTWMLEPPSNRPWCRCD